MAVALATLAFRLVTTRFGFSLKKLAPDPARLNPLAKLRELPRQNLPSLLQAVVLLPLFLWAVYAIARDKLDVLPGAAAGERGERLRACWPRSLMELFWKAAGVFLVFGAVDLFRQMRRHQRDLRMSKQEIRDEMKDMEGNPQMKARIRRLQRDRARRQMMKEVPKATAVVVNPTHYAVALRYQLDSMARSAGGGQGQELPGAAHPRRRPWSTRCRSSRIRRWRRRCTSRWRSARRFRRTSIARWPKFWPTSSS